MPVLYEGRHSGEYVAYEEENQYSVEAITVAAGADLYPGTVLGRIPTATATAAAKTGGNTGAGTIAMDGTTPVLDGVKSGVYTVRMTAATAFTVEDPDGVVIGTGATGTAFADDVKFTVTASGTAFVAGDGFDITVGPISYVYKQLAPAATDGTQVAVGILRNQALAASAAKASVAHVRQAIATASEIVWPSGITSTQKTIAINQLRVRNILIR